MTTVQTALEHGLRSIADAKRNDIVLPPKDMRSLLEPLFSDGTSMGGQRLRLPYFGTDGVTVLQKMGQGKESCLVRTSNPTPVRSGTDCGRHSLYVHIGRLVEGGERHGSSE